MMLVACGQNVVPDEQGTSPKIAEPAHTFKLLIIDSQAGEPYKSAREALLNTLNDLGYIENSNLKISHYTVGNDVDLAETILNENLKNDVILANGTVATIAAKNLIFDKPEHQVVFVCVTDPIGIGVIEAFDEPPQHNFTGVSYPVTVKSRLKFVHQLAPEAKVLGMVYADMPQSNSYHQWLETLLQEDPDFQDIEIIFRKVPFVEGEAGIQIMAESARAYIKELDSQVDLFLAPNDQMGISQEFVALVYAMANKPLVGISRNDVVQDWGATMTIYPVPEVMGKQTAQMIATLFEGNKINQIPAERPKEFGFAFDLRKTERFGIDVPIEFIELAGDNIIK